MIGIRFEFESICAGRDKDDENAACAWFVRATRVAARTPAATDRSPFETNPAARAFWCDVAAVFARSKPPSLAFI